ncbi:MAG TPA: ABC transporter ATP-binding protein [Bacteroidota bacterium]|nr:ABC transporter ATP-binding protein [Bacteroidota bacterium]
MHIEIAELSKEYGGRRVLNVDRLSFHATEIVGLVGNNGAGKTTLLRLMLDLVRATSGEVRSNDRVVSRSEEWKEYTGAYLGESFLIDYLKPREFFEFVAEVRGVDGTELARGLNRYSGFLAGTGLDTRATLIRGLSEGNRQKIGIIAALLGDPRTVILDEPFANLDPTSQYLLKSLLREYCLRTRSLIVLSSHNLVHVADLCSRVILLEGGKIIRDDSLLGREEEVLSSLERYFASPLPPP